MTDIHFNETIVSMKQKTLLLGNMFESLNNRPIFDTIQIWVYTKTYQELGTFLGEFHPVMDGIEFRFNVVDGHNAFEEIVIDIINLVFEYYGCRPSDFFDVKKMLTHYYATQ